MTRAWIAGDCWLKPGGSRINLLPVWNDVPPAVFAVNLECSIPAGPVRTGRRALLPLDAARLPELRTAQNTVCILANNHVTDYGFAGLLATLEEVRRAGLHPLGAGATLSEAREPVIIDIEGRRIGLLAYADTRPHVGAVAATDLTAGVAPLDLSIVTHDVQQLARRVRDVWVFLHWGRENLRYPDPEQRSIAMTLAEMGAKLIVGTHPHVPRGWEQVANTTVYYSLGNFVFPPIPLPDGFLLRWDHENSYGIALRGSIRGNDWCWAHVPFVISATGEPGPLTHPDQQAMKCKIASLSEALGDNYIRQYPRIWRREVGLHAVRRLRMLTWGERLRLPGRLIRAAFRRSPTHESKP